MRVIAYDLDGVLAQSPPSSPKKWGHMKGDERRMRKLELLHWYSKAAILFNPPEQFFYIVTARKADSIIRDVTYLWLKQNFPGRIKGVHHLKVSRSLENVIKFKTEILIQIKATEFTEDNVAVVAGVRKALPAVYTWLFKDGKKLPDPRRPYSGG